jgi:GTPase KRas protein
VFKKFRRDYTSTIEDIFNMRTLIDDDMAEIDILDTAGLDEFKGVRDAKIKDRDGFIIMYDVSDKGSFERIESLYEAILVHHIPPVDIPIVLVGNKIDKERVVDIEEAERLAAKHWSPYIECSALSGDNIEEVFSLLIRELRKK